MTVSPSKKTGILVALLVAAAVAVGGGLLSHGNKPDAASGTNPDKPLDATHEKAFLNEQLRRNPEHAPILLRLAQIERTEGNLSGARDHLRQALQGDGNLSDIHLELGLVLSELGDLAGAEEQNRSVLRFDPKQPDALYNLGAIYANRGDAIEARRFWEDAVNSGGASDSVEKSRLALSRLNSGR